MFGKKKNKKVNFGTAQKPRVPKEILNSRELRKFVYGNHIPKFSVDYLKFIYNSEFKKNRVLLIRMFLRNGKFTEFLITPDKPVFDYCDGSYIIDSDFIVDEVGNPYSSLLYHQDLSVPLEITVDVNTIKGKVANNKNYADVVQNINPQTLKSVLHSNTIQKVMAGGEIEGVFRTLLYFAIGNAVATFILILMIGYGNLR